MRVPNLRIRARDDRGAQMVEFALIFTFVLGPLMLGIINFGYVFGQQLSLNQAAREGARKAVVSSTATSTQIEGFVRSSTGGLISPTTAISVTTNTNDQLTSTPTFDTTTVDGVSVPRFLTKNIGTTCGTNATYNRLGGQLQVIATYPAKWLVPTFIPLTAPSLTATSVFRCEAI